MGHFPTSLRNKMSEEEEIGWEGFWKWHEEEQQRKKKRRKDPPWKRPLKRMEPVDGF